MRMPIAPSRDEAETIAIRLVAELAERPDLLRRFLDLAGLTPDDLRARLQDPALLGAVFDFVLFDEQLTLELADALALEASLFGAARRQLPGAPVES